MVLLLQMMNLYWHIITKVHSSIWGFTLGVHFMGLNKCVMIYIHHYNTEYFHCPRASLCSAYLTCSNHESLHWLYSFVLSKCYTDGIIQYVTVSDWFLSLNNICLSFLHLFLWPHSHCKTLWISLFSSSERFLDNVFPFTCCLGILGMNSWAYGST